MSNNYIKNIAIVGAAGQQGKHVVNALLATGKHSVTAVTREDSTNTDSIASGVTIKKVNYENQDSLVTALKGQDCLIITMSVQAPPGTSEKLIEAAAKAGVPWILPNEWGSDYNNEQLSKDIFIGVVAQKNRALIEKLGVSSWIGISCGFWYQYSLGTSPILYGFDFQNRAVTFYDEGKQPLNTSTWEQTALAVAKILSLPISGAGSDEMTLEKDFKNTYANINSFRLSQKDMFESVKRVTGTTDADWKINYQPSKERYEEGLKQYQGGDRMGFGKLLYARMFYPGLEVPDPINEKLGLPKEDLDECTKGAIERSEMIAKSRGAGAS
ncbi:hypothetical protein H2198_004306 [Neophaeococcomyces mojaviensis]|uniref:Uncharacterized protein n=1 Tax=Neophaeococcomyces mojaviensis TaxID=3383035 RepID=A0ACC3A8V7_9EURO|nr:hypothetical protein H2198_004306 [Knufia sp. JES_112]